MVGVWNGPAMKPLNRPYATRPIAAVFDALANEYEVNRLSAWYRSGSEMLLDLMARNETRSLLDIGCATGWLLRQSVERQCLSNGVGIDISPQMIRVAREAARQHKFSNLDFIHADWEDFEFCPPHFTKFDVVVCAHTLHYFKEPLLALKKIHNHLHHGGRFFLIERDTTGSALTLLWEIIHQRILREQIKFFSISELKDMMRHAGFHAPRVITKIKRVFWRKKMFTSIAIIQGLN